MSLQINPPRIIPINKKKLKVENVMLHYAAALPVKFSHCFPPEFV